MAGSTIKTTNGFFAGLVTFMCALAIGSFCTVVEYYAGAVIIITAIIFWINFIFVGVRHKRCFAIFMLIFYGIALEVIICILIGLYTFYIISPGNSPMCKSCKRSKSLKECKEDCSNLSSPLLIVLFLALGVSNFIALIFMYHFRVSIVTFRSSQLSNAVPGQISIGNVCSTILPPPPYISTLLTDAVSTTGPPPYTTDTNDDQNQHIDAEPPSYTDIVKSNMSQQ